MRLELRKAHVTGLEWGSPTRMENGVLYVDKEGLIAALSDDDRIEKWDVDLARPGESVRIIPVKDVIEPRVKLEGGESYFASVIGPNDTAGEGATFVLDGAGVVTVGPIMGFQEGFIDMSGPAAKFSPFAELFNVVLIARPVENLEKHQYEEAIRVAGLKAAVWLADCCKNAKIDATEVFEKGTVAEELKKYPDLPPVVHLCMCITQGLLHDTYVYGADVKTCLPTLLHPNEVLDGAMVSGNCVSACDKNSTYVHLNNPIIKSLYEHHGKDLNFIGVVITNENVTLADKKRSSSYAVKLAQTLGADAAVISEEGFGNPDADLVMNCWKCERKGIKTVLVTDEYANRDGASQSLADTCPEGDACVTAGNANATITLPPMDRIIGDTQFADVMAGGFFGSLKEDGSIFAEIQIITGATSEVGFTKNGAYTI